MDIDVVGLLTSFKGRVNRGKYWLAALIYFIVSVIVTVIGKATGEGLLFQLVNLVATIAIFVSSIAVGLKRLHDRDKSGWWLLMFYVLPGVLIGAAVLSGIGSAMSGGSGGTAILLSFAAVGVMIWSFVELGCLRGTVGPNRYGPDPLAGREPV